MVENLLDICIPTLNRARMLEDCLSALVPEAKKHNATIWISDNCSSDDTAEVVARARAEYSRVECRTSDTTVEGDLNFERALMAGNSKYAWLIGDSMKIEPGFLGHLVQILSQGDYDSVLVNAGGRVKGIPSQEYHDRNCLLRDLGWHITTLSSIVYSRALLNEASFSRFYDSNFLHMGILLDVIAFRPFSIYWCSESGVNPSALPKLGHWYPRQTLSIFGMRWMSFVLSLPRSYDVSTKLACIQKHGIATHLMTLRGFMLLRVSGCFPLSEWVLYHRWLHYWTTVPRWLLLLVAVAPVNLEKTALSVRDHLRTRRLGRPAPMGTAVSRAAP